VLEIGIAVEGPTDRAAAFKILSSRGLVAAPELAFVVGGKTKLDPKIKAYNQAAQRRPWLVIRDLDRDGNDCPVALREFLLPEERQSPAMCLRIAVRCLEAWLLADAGSVSGFFKVPQSQVPLQPENLDDPKRVLVGLCAKSKSSAVRRGMAPPNTGTFGVGPEYTAQVVEFFRDAWDPDTARQAAPSLARALDHIDRLCVDGIWR
jgi:hypothetical protein